MKKIISTLLSTIIVFSSAVSLYGAGDLSVDVKAAEKTETISDEQTTQLPDSSFLVENGASVSDSLRVVGSDKNKVEDMVDSAKADIVDADKEFSKASTGADTNASSTGAGINIHLKFCVVNRCDPF